jgi:hypothetical protein
MIYFFNDYIYDSYLCLISNVTAGPMSNEHVFVCLLEDVLLQEVDDMFNGQLRESVSSVFLMTLLSCNLIIDTAKIIALARNVHPRKRPLLVTWKVW